MLPTGSKMAIPTPTHLLVHDYEREMKLLQIKIDKYNEQIDELTDKAEALEDELDNMSGFMRFFDTKIHEELHEVRRNLSHLYYCSSKYHEQYTKLLHEEAAYREHVREECKKRDEGREKSTAEIAVDALGHLTEAQKVCYLSSAYPDNDITLFLNNGGSIKFNAGHHPNCFYGKDKALYFETEDHALEIIMDACIDGIELAKKDNN